MISAIILNYNDYENCISLVNSLKKNKLISSIIVVDNNSTDKINQEVLSKIPNEKTHVILNQNNFGYSHGNNIGIAYALDNDHLFKYFMICNPDIIVDCCTIESMYNFLNNESNVAAVAPLMKYPDNTIFQKNAWNLVNMKSVFGEACGKNINYIKTKDDKKAIYAECLPGSLFLIKKNVFKEVGYFDENVFLYFEEDILGYKLKNIEFKQALLLDVNYIHKESVSIKKTYTIKKSRKRMRQSLKYYLQNYLKYRYIKLTLTLLFFDITTFRIIHGRNSK